MLSLFDIDLYVAVAELDVETSLLDCCTITPVPDIANNISNPKRMVRQVVLDSTHLIRKRHQSVPTRESIEITLRIPLNLLKKPPLLLLSDLNNRLQKVVHITLCIHTSPKCFSAIRIIGSTETLLSSIVNNRDSFLGNNKCQGALIRLNATFLVQESAIIMIVYKVS